MLCEKCYCEIEVKTINRLTSNEVINKVCEIYKVSPTLALGKFRWKNLVECRQIISHILRNDKYLSMSYKSIGFMLGRRDHTTIIHSIQSIENYIDTEPAFKEKVINIYKLVYGSADYFNR